MSPHYPGASDGRKVSEDIPFPPVEYILYQIELPEGKLYQEREASEE